MSNTVDETAAAEAETEATSTNNDLVVDDEEPYQQYVYKDVASNNKDITYTIRGLVNDDEIHKWSKFCESIFAYKLNPPLASYFERHYYNDPNGIKYGPSLIRVAIDNDTQEIVASCRVFVRDISKGGEEQRNNTNNTNTLRAGGIGEVCTSNQHRKRGLSKILLLDCIRIMKTTPQLNLQVSLLHAAPTFFPVYEKAGGYQNTTSEWSSVQVSYKSEDHHHDHDREQYKYYNIRVAQFPNDTKELQMLHEKYSVQKFPGCIIRNEEYWNTYISKELDNSLYVLTYNNVVVGWLSIRPRGGENTYQLREFGCRTTYDEGVDGKGTSNAELAMEYLFPHAMHQLHPDRSSSTTACCTLILPTFVLDQIKERGTSSSSKKNKKPKLEEESKKRFNVDWSTVKPENDLGWMYLSLSEDDDETNEWLDTILVDNKDKKNNNNDKGSSSSHPSRKRPHLIWPSDSF